MYMEKETNNDNTSELIVLFNLLWSKRKKIILAF